MRNEKDSRTTRKTRSASSRAGFAIALAVVIVAATGLWWWSSSGGEPVAGERAAPKNVTLGNASHGVNETPNTPAARPAPAGWSARDIVMLVLFCISVAAIIGWVAAATWRAPPGQGAADGGLAAITAMNAILLPYGIVASWIYRIELGNAVVDATAFALALWVEVQKLSTKEQILLFTAVVLAAVEIVYLNIYKVFYRRIWRLLFPDLVLVPEAEGISKTVGRAYRWEKGDDGAWMVRFTKQDESWRRLFSGLHVLRTTQEPTRASKFTLELRAMDIERAAIQGWWALTNENHVTVPIAHDSAKRIFSRALEDNQNVSREGLEGNPHHLAKRMDQDATGHNGGVRTFRPRGGGLP